MTLINDTISPITFDEASHVYKNVANNQRYYSATQIIEHYRPEFDNEFWLYYKVLQDVLGYENDEVGKKKYSKYLREEFRFSFRYKHIDHLKAIAQHLGVDKQIDVAYKQKEWKDENKKSTDKGTKFHEDIERKRLAQKTKILECGNTVHFRSFNKGLEETSFGSEMVEGIPELRLYNHKYRIAGTTDDPIFFPNRIVDINDWKTNKAIKFENSWDKMLYPLNHLDDCNFNHYNIQLSLYGWMLEQFGYKVRNLSITHVLFDENNEAKLWKVYPMKYLKTEVENLLEHYVANHQR